MKLNGLLIALLVLLAALLLVVTFALVRMGEDQREAHCDAISNNLTDYFRCMS